MTERIRVLVVDDHADLANVLARFIALEPDMEHVGTLHSADAFVSTIERAQPHVAIVDLTMDGKPPLEAVREASEKHPTTRSIVFSGRMDDELVQEAMDAGAWGFVCKQGDPREVIGAVRRVASGEMVQPQG